MRFRKIEFRFSKYNNKYELVSWYENTDGSENCYVIAFFDKHKDLQLEYENYLNHETE